MNPLQSLARPRQRMLALVATATLFLGSLPARLAAETTFPSQPINLIVPFPPGGNLDATARLVAEGLQSRLRQPVVVVNRPGAGTAVGARLAAQAKPDGYTLFIASGSAFGYLSEMVPSFKHQLKDFKPLAGVAIYTSLFAATSASAIRSLPELVAQAHAKPGAISVCSTGTNGLNHLQLEMFKELVKAKTGTALQVTHVPYNGLAPALTALRAGEVQACVLPYSSIVSNFEGKGIHIIALQRPDRLAAIPQIATAGEQGYTALDENVQLVTISAPAGTPEAISQRIEVALRSTMDDPGVIGKLNELNIQPANVGAKDAQQWLEKDVARFTQVIRAAKLTSQE